MIISGEFYRRKGATYLAFRTFRLLRATFEGADIGPGYDGLAASPAVLKQLLFVCLWWFHVCGTYLIATGNLYT